MSIRIKMYFLVMMSVIGLPPIQGADDSDDFADAPLAGSRADNPIDSQKVSSTKTKPRSSSNPSDQYASTWGNASQVGGAKINMGLMSSTAGFSTSSTATTGLSQSTLTKSSQAPVQTQSVNPASSTTSTTGSSQSTATSSSQVKYTPWTRPNPVLRREHQPVGGGGPYNAPMANGVLHFRHSYGDAIWGVLEGEQGEGDDILEYCIVANNKCAYKELPNYKEKQSTESGYVYNSVEVVDYKFYVDRSVKVDYKRRKGKKNPDGTIKWLSGSDKNAFQEWSQTYNNLQ